MKIECGFEKHNGKNEKKKLNDRNTRREDKKHMKRLKLNKWNEEEVNWCKNELNKSKRLEVELIKYSVKGCEKNDNLSLRIKSNNTKAGHDELVEKLKIKQRRVFPFYENQ